MADTGVVEDESRHILVGGQISEPCEACEGAFIEHGCLQLALEQFIHLAVNFAFSDLQAGDNLLVRNRLHQA